MPQTPQAFRKRLDLNLISASPSLFTLSAKINNKYIVIKFKLLTNYQMSGVQGCSPARLWGSGGNSKPPRFLGTFCSQVSTFALQKPAYAVRISFRCQVPRRRQINRFPMKSDISRKIKTTTKLVFEIFLLKKIYPYKPQFV